MLIKKALINFKKLKFKIKISYILTNSLKFEFQNHKEFLKNIDGWLHCSLEYKKF